MATKTISITEEAYLRLKMLKHDGESFTDVINRLTNKHSLWEIVGILTDEEARKMEDAIAEGRKRSRARMERIAREMRQ